MPTPKNPPEPEDKPMDETVPGGRYDVDGVIVDSTGKPIDKDKSKNPEEPK